jgi:anti-anti-sigma factor
MFHQVAGATVLVLIGELDLDVAATVRAQLDAAAEGEHDVIVDLRELRFIDSSGIKTLVDAYRLFARAQRKLALVISSPPMQHIFRIVGVDQILPVFPTFEAAVESLA